MFTTDRRPFISGMLAIAAILVLTGVLTLLPVPLNPIWQLFSGYYHYDPRHDVPPPGLVADLPEAALTYYVAATLTACAAQYLHALPHPIQRYEAEAVEYFGKTHRHAASRASALVHTRFFDSSGASRLVTFRFEATRNQEDVWYSEYGSVVRAGGWRPVEGLIPATDVSPPGIPQWANKGPHTCDNVGHPYAIHE